MTKKKKKLNKKEKEEQSFLAIFAEEKNGRSVRDMLQNPSERRQYLRWKKRKGLINNEFVDAVTSKKKIVASQRGNLPQINIYQQDFDYQKFIDEVMGKSGVCPDVLEKALYHSCLQKIANGETKSLDIAFKILTKISPKYQDTRSTSTTQDYESVWQTINIKKESIENDNNDQSSSSQVSDVPKQESEEK